MIRMNEDFYSTYEEIINLPFHVSTNEKEELQYTRNWKDIQTYFKPIIKSATKIEVSLDGVIQSVGNTPIREAYWDDIDQIDLAITSGTGISINLYKSSFEIAVYYHESSEIFLIHLLDKKQNALSILYVSNF